jgi:cytidyltransferase-like protein
MKKVVVISGGFHPFHAGHMSLYDEAQKAFPGAHVIVGATNNQKDRPFPFNIKQKLAQVSGVPPKDFVEVTRQFSVEDPVILQKIGDLNNTAVIFVRSEKDRNEQPKGLPLNPAVDEIPVASRGPNKGKPMKLLDYDVNADNLQPASQHTYMAYLPTVKFGPGITSASEIRELWYAWTKVLLDPNSTPKQKAKAKELKTTMVKSLYPATQKNPELATNVVQLLDFGMGVESVEEGKGIPYPSTYEQENNMFKKRGPERFIAMTTESKVTENSDYLEEK